MHILITVNATWNLLNFRRSLLEALLNDGHQITILAPTDQTSDTLHAMGCAIIPLAMDIKGLSPHKDLALMQRLRAVFRAQKPDVILSYTIKNNIYGALAAHPLKIPFIPNVTGLGTAFLSGGLLQKIAETLYKIAFKSPTTIFFQNPDDRVLFLERKLCRVIQAHVLPGSGIDLNHFQPSPLPNAPAPVFLMIARLLKDKGVFEYVEAARLIRKNHPNARFRLLGPLSTANRSAVSEEVLQAWKTEGVVEYLGETDDVRPFIKAADCVVLPSYREGAPRTLIEAAAMARPLIASDVPGCRSVVEHGKTGFLCAAQSSESLAHACQTLLDMSPEARNAMGQAGRIKMQTEYDQELVINAYRRVLGQIT